MILAPKTSRRPKRAPQPENVPSPEAIRRMTEEIRKSWKPRDFCRRSNTVDHLEVTQMPLQSRRRGFWGE